MFDLDLVFVVWLFGRCFLFVWRRGLLWGVGGVCFGWVCLWLDLFVVFMI